MEETNSSDLPPCIYTLNPQLISPAKLGNHAATKASIEAMYGSMTTGRPDMTTTTHLTAPQTLLIIVGPGSNISSVWLSPCISA
ncbi:Multidrug resistance protein MdtC [Bienertia sinuspersici]